MRQLVPSSYLTMYLSVCPCMCPLMGPLCAPPFAPVRRCLAVSVCGDTVCCCDHIRWAPYGVEGDKM